MKLPRAVNPEINDDTPFRSIIIPTIDTVRSSWVLETLMAHSFHVLFSGPTGTGKTISVNQMLYAERSEEDIGMPIDPIAITFSARTTAAQTLALIDSKLGMTQFTKHGNFFHIIS